MRNTVIVIAILISSCCLAQSDNNGYSDAINKICPDADIINIEVKGDYTEVEYSCNGTLFETSFDIDKNVISTETETMIPSDIMYVIQKKLDKKYQGWVVDEFAMVKTQDTSFYKAEMVKSGIEENVYFTLDGKYYRPKNLIVNEDWDLKTLASSSYFKNAPYSFLNPDKTFDMPDVLKEISGIALAGNSILYCIQDETGAIFKYNMEKDELSGMLRYTDKGDFEDITVHNDTAYILRSDGTLFYFNHKNFDGKVNQLVVPLNCMNIEGIFFNKSDHSIYIACKDPEITDYGDNRVIYRVSADRISTPDVALIIKLNEINKKVTEIYPSLSGKKFQFNPSAIAIHPVTNEKYILSASNRFLAIYNQNGLNTIYPLPAEIYYKPEGIAFTETGDMYISSEGMKDGHVGGQIYYFKYGKQHDR